MSALKHIVIVGGDYEAWMAAANLSRALSVPSTTGQARLLSRITVVGRRASTGRVISGLPPFRAFNAMIGLSEPALFSECAALPFVASRFDGFGAPFYRVIGEHGTRFNTAAFHHVVTWLRQGGETPVFDRYSLAAQMAEAGRFSPPSNDPNSVLSSFSYGLNIDGGAYAQMLRKRALASAVEEIAATVSEILSADGQIGGLVLDSGQTVTGDLYIDASAGEAGLLAQLGVGFEASNLKAHTLAEVAVPISKDVPANRYQAEPWGWSARFGLATGERLRVVWGDDGEAYARACLAAAAPDADIVTASCHTRRANRFWVGNCVAVGSSAGRFDPLGIDGVQFLQSGLAHLIGLFPDASMPEVLATEYNRLMTAEFDRTADYLHLFYALAKGPEGDFWVKTELDNLPQTVARKIEQFRSRGRVVMYDEETLGEGDFVSVMLGLGVEPQRYERRIDAIDPVRLRAQVDAMQAHIDRVVDGLPRFERLRQRPAQSA